MFKNNTYRLRTVNHTLVVVFSLVALLSLTLTGLYARTVTAAPSTNLNFQARLKNASGGVVPDGNYNIEFKLYDVSTGGTALWTETRTGANVVRVANGYMTVNLGSVTAFPGTIQWGEQHWITMNIGGTGSPSWDGEMNPRLQLTAVPFAFKAENANNVSSANQSTSSTNSSNVSIQSGNATGATSNSGNITLDAGTATGTAGTISLGATNTSSLILGRAGLTTLNNGSLTVAQNFTVDTNSLFVDATNNSVGIGTTSPGTTRLVVTNVATTDNIASFMDNTTEVLGIANGGAITIKNQTDSTSALLIQRAGAGGTLFTVDSSTTSGSRNGILSVGASDTNATLLVLDIKTDAGDPTGSDGSMYYNSNLAKFRCYENGGWRDCIASSTSGFLMQVPSSTAINTVTPTANSVQALTVNGTSGTAATALVVSQTGATSAQVINLTNTAGTQTSGLSIARSGVGGTTTSLIDLTQSGGTVTNGILFNGTIGTDITTAAARALTIVSGTTGAVTFDSGTSGTVNIGTNANAKTVNIATGAAVGNSINIGGTGGNAINLGNTQTAGTINLGAAMTTGTITIGGTGLQTGAIGIGTGTGAQTLNLGTGGTGIKTINIGTGAVNNPINIGGTGTNTIAIGNTQAAGSIALGAAMTTGTITIGGTGLQTGTIALGTGTGNQIINLGVNVSGIKTINIGGSSDNIIAIGNTQAGGSISLGSAMTTGTLSIGGTGLQTGTINLGTGTGVQSINLATGGTGAKTVVVGSLASTGSTTIQSGTGNILFQAAGAGTIGVVRVGAGGAGSATPDYLALDVKNSTGDPAGGAEGYMYYNTTDNKFRCFQNAAWTDCIGTAGAGDFEATYSVDSDKTLTVSTSTGFGIDLTSTGDFVVEDNGVGIATFSNIGGISFAPQGTEDVAITTDADSTFRLTGFTQNNGIVYTDSSGNFQQTATGGAGTLCLISAAGGAPTFGSCSGSSSTAWSSLTAPSSNLSINMGNFTTDFTFGDGNWTNNLNGTGDFVIQDAGINAFVVTDTGSINLGKSDAGVNITIGDGSASSTPNLLVLDAKNTSGDPAGTAGAMYYNSNSNKFRCYQGTAWTDCISPWITIRKTADQDVTNSSAYVNDTALTFAVASGVVYTVRFNICYTGTSTAGDYKGQFVFPATIATKNSSGRYVNTNTTDTVTSSAGVLGASTTVWGNIAMGTAAVMTDKRVFEGAFTVQPNSAGSITYQFAQNIATVSTAARTCSGSFIEYQAL